MGQPAAADGTGQDGVIRRVIDRIGQPHQREAADQRPIGRDDPGQRHAAGAHHQPADQEPPCAQPVDQESRGRLENRRDHVEAGDHHGQPLIAHRVIHQHEREQRRQHQHVDVAREMRAADQADDLGVARPGGNAGDVGHFRHARRFLAQGRGWGERGGRMQAMRLGPCAAVDRFNFSSLLVCRHSVPY